MSCVSAFHCAPTAGLLGWLLQVFVPSKDGTKIPMFIVARKNVTLDGNNPTFLYAYGGALPCLRMQRLGACAGMELT